jgi:hypothetical protein
LLPAADEGFLAGIGWLPGLDAIFWIVMVCFWIL